MPSQSTCAFNTTSALLFQAVEEIASGKRDSGDASVDPAAFNTFKVEPQGTKRWYSHGGDIDDAGSLTTPLMVESTMLDALLAPELTPTTMAFRLIWHRR